MYFFNTHFAVLKVLFFCVWYSLIEKLAGFYLQYFVAPILYIRAVT